MKKLPVKFCVEGMNNKSLLTSLFEKYNIDYNRVIGDGDIGTYYHVDNGIVEKCDSYKGDLVIDLSTYSKESSISFNYLIL